MMMKWHPDKNPNNPEFAATMFKKIGNAKKLILKRVFMEDEVGFDESWKRRGGRKTKRKRKVKRRKLKGRKSKVKRRKSKKN